MTAAVEIPPVLVGTARNIQIRHGVRTPVPESFVVSMVNILATEAGNLALTPAIMATTLSGMVQFSPPKTAALVAVKDTKMSLKEKIHHLLMGASEITRLHQAPIRARSKAEVTRVAELAYDRFEADAERRMND